MNTTKPITVARADARELYLRIFDDFAVVVKDKSEDNSALQVTVDAINMYLDGTDAVAPDEASAGQTIVRDWMNNDYEVWQCFQTYDSISREQAEALFDKAWPVDHGDLAIYAAATKTCFCGCGAEVKSKRSVFAPGHDAKFAGNLIRAARSGEMKAADAIMLANSVSSALGAKVDAGISREAKPRVARKVTPGTVQIGRWVYPARRKADGTVERNTKRDGLGEWITSGPDNGKKRGGDVYTHYRGIFKPQV